MNRGGHKNVERISSFAQERSACQSLQLAKIQGMESISKPRLRFEIYACEEILSTGDWSIEGLSFFPSLLSGLWLGFLGFFGCALWGFFLTFRCQGIYSFDFFHLINSGQTSHIPANNLRKKAAPPMGFGWVAPLLAHVRPGDRGRLISIGRKKYS
jgi:hypothetical protein